MNYHLLPLTGVLLALAALTACTDDQPQKIATPVPPAHDPVPPAPAVNHLTDIDPTAARDATVTEGDRQKSASPAPKTGLLSNSPAPAPAPLTTGTGSADRSSAVPLLPNRDAATTQDTPIMATDNSGKNTRDDGSLLTPLDQGLGEADQTITQGIRKVVTDQPSLSVNGKNVKIITRDGAVTLRGPVADAREREVIYAIALAQPNVKTVNNLLEPLQK